MKSLTLVFFGLVLTATALPTPADNQVAKNPPSISDKTFQKIITDTHRELRWPHCAQDLVWDDGLARLAQASVSKCTTDLVHDAFGTNLIGGDPAPDDYYHTSMKMVHQWYSEVTKYDYNRPGFDDATGHFTQLIWRDSSRIGCAWAQCTNGVKSAARMYCYYHNIGNIVDSGNNLFRANVWPSVCAANPSPDVPN